MECIFEITNRWTTLRLNESLNKKQDTPGVYESPKGLLCQVLPLEIKSDSYVVVLSYFNYSETLLISLRSLKLDELELSGELDTVLAMYDRRFCGLYETPAPRDTPVQMTAARALDTNKEGLDAESFTNTTTNTSTKTADPNGPPGFEDEYQLRDKPQAYTRPLGPPPSFGDRDLDPVGKNPTLRGFIDPLGQPSGGMHPTADDPLFQNPGRLAGPSGSLRVPPGARFDDPLFGGGDLDLVGQGLPGNLGLRGNRPGSGNGGGFAPFGSNNFGGGYI